MSADVSRTDENDYPDESQHQPDEHCTARTPPRRPHPLDDHQPKGKDRDEQSRQSRWNELFGPDHSPVSAEQEKATGNDRVAPMQPGRLGGAPVSRPDVQERARDQKTRTAHDERRYRLDRIPNCEIRRAPDDVNRSERSDYLRARGAFLCHSETKMGRVADRKSVV